MIRPRPAVFFLAALATLLSGASPATAALTPIFDALPTFKEPNLIGVNPWPDNLKPSVLETLYGEQNVRRIDDRQDVAFRHTGIEASVREVAHFTGGALTLAYLAPGATDPILILRNIRPPQPPQGYTPHTEGSGLIPLADTGLIFSLVYNVLTNSDPRLNASGRDALVTFQIIGNADHPGNHIGNYILAWEDNPNGDRDFQDQVYELTGAVPIPEPTPVTLVFSIALCLVLIEHRPASRSCYN